MTSISKYIFRQLAIATLFVIGVLTVLVTLFGSPSPYRLHREPRAPDYGAVRDERAQSAEIRRDPAAHCCLCRRPCGVQQVAERQRDGGHARGGDEPGCAGATRSAARNRRRLYRLCAAALSCSGDNPRIQTEAAQLPQFLWQRASPGTALQHADPRSDDLHSGTQQRRRARGIFAHDPRPRTPRDLHRRTRHRGSERRRHSCGVV